MQLRFKNLENEILEIFNYKDVKYDHSCEQSDYYYALTHNNNFISLKVTSDSEIWKRTCNGWEMYENISLGNIFN